MSSGWMQVAFERDLAEGLNEADFGGAPVALVRAGDRVEAFDAVCPHRGANLCRGGTLAGDAIRCPFHGLSIGLGEGEGLRARALACLVIGGLVFVREPDAPDHGFEARLRALDTDRYFVPGFALAMAAPAAMIVENAFDALHFRIVHGIGNTPELRPVAGDGYTVAGVFRLPPSPWQGSGAVAVPYRASAYSPHLVLTELGGARPYAMLTAATPTGERSCLVRLSLAVPAGAEGAAPSAEDCRYLLDGARRGLAEDQPIWEAMRPGVFNPVAGEVSVEGFRRFCEGFA